MLPQNQVSQCRLELISRRIFRVDAQTAVNKGTGRLLNLAGNRIPCEHSLCQMIGFRFGRRRGIG